MIRPAQVLPSEILPSNDGEHTSTELEEHFSTHQYSDYPYISTSDQKYSPSLLIENSYLDRQPAHQPQHSHQLTPIQRHNPRYDRFGRYHGSSGHYGRYADPKRNEKIARYLYHRFRASDQYMKYRDRQQKTPKNSEEQKWPDRLELAFFQALVHYPPMGRRQLPLKDKRRGRNELISDYIEEVTGEVRDRKQISSHIQVLTPFVKHDPFIMKWLRYPKGKQSRREENHPSWFDHQGAINDVPPLAMCAARPPQLGLSTLAFRSLADFKDSLDVFEPTDFSMFVQRKLDDTDNARVERLHTYTSSIIQALQPQQQIPTWQSLQRNFPLLDAVHQRRPLDCNVLMAEASIGFPEFTLKDQNGIALPGIELGILFLCSSRNLPIQAAIKCHNTFYKNGHLLDANPTDVRLAPAKDGTSHETQLKFGSTFWAKTLGSIAHRLDNDADPIKAREDMSHNIKGINAIQEVFIMLDSQPHRLLVIHWSFRLSKVKQGRAYWMPVILPAEPEYREQEQKTERMDSVHYYPLNLDSDVTPQITLPASSSDQQSTLMSPFSYDDTSASIPTSTSALSWPVVTTTCSSIDDPSTTAPQSAIDWNYGDNPFDFPTATDDVSFDPNLDFSAFDSYAFDAAAAAAGPDFAITDPSLQDYSQDFAQMHGYVPESEYPWYEGEMAGPVGKACQVSTRGQPSRQQRFDEYAQYEQAYGVGGGEIQAFGGAGEEMLKQGDPLPGLPDGDEYVVDLQSEEEHVPPHQTQWKGVDV